MIALLLTAWADPVVDALEEELARAGELSLPNAPTPYIVRYRLARLDQMEVHGHFGDLLEEDATPYNQLGIELRVGSPELDNTGLSSWGGNGFTQVSLGVRPSPLLARQLAWKRTDQTFKGAVEQYARKLSQFDAPEDWPGDYWVPEPSQLDLGAPAPTAWDDLPGLVRSLSSPFREAGDRLILGATSIGAENGSQWLLDDQGTRVRLPTSEVSVRTYAALRTEDGELLTDQRLWVARTSDQLPPEAEMVAASAALRDGLLTRAEAEVLADEYVGPVLFEGDAALDLFVNLLVPQLEGTPPEISPFLGTLGDSGNLVRVGRRVLPEGWQVDDDPLRDPHSPAAFEVDAEGVRARPVDLVEDGIVRDLLMSSVPRKDLEPNGHARGGLGSRASGRASQLAVTPERTTSRRKLLKRALKMAAAYGHDEVIVVRRLQHEAVRSLAGEFDTSLDELTLPPPVEIVRVGADGTETRLRGARFASVQRYLIRDIALAGPLNETTFLAPMDAARRYPGLLAGLPTHLSAPDVLVREIEIVPATLDTKARPVLPFPAPSETP